MAFHFSAVGRLGAVVQVQTESGGAAIAQIVESVPKTPKKIGGETPAAARGRQAHKEHDYGPGFKKEDTLPSGKRPDAFNPETGEVIELKPNNARAIRRGERQVEGYRRELEDVYGRPFTGRVETYDP